MSARPIAKADVTVEFAFHVTNVPCEQAKPQWTELKWHPADDPYFDGKILQHAPGVYFMTTKFGSDILTRSVYPRFGQPEEFYWCIKVPLKNFDQYHILWLHEQRTERAMQVRLVLLTDEDANRIAPELRQLLEQKAEKYLRRRRSDPNSDHCVYYSNDYQDESTRYFVSFAICDSYLIPPDATWAQMEHGEHLPGCQQIETADQIEKSREERMNEFIERINSMLNPEYKSV